MFKILQINNYLYFNIFFIHFVIKKMCSSWNKRYFVKPSTIYVTCTVISLLTTIRHNERMKRRIMPFRKSRFSKRSMISCNMNMLVVLNLQYVELLHTLKWAHSLSSSSQHGWEDNSLIIEVHFYHCCGINLPCIISFYFKMVTYLTINIHRRS